MLLLAMAAGQLSDLVGFARVLDGYRFIPQGWLTPAAWLLAGVEASAALALLRHRRSGSLLALAVAMVWSALAVQAFARGLVVDNCGCFGVHLAQSLRWWVLLEDAEFVALAAWVRRAERHSGEPTGRASDSVGDDPRPLRTAGPPLNGRDCADAPPRDTP